MKLIDLLSVAGSVMAGSEPPCSLVEAVKLVHTAIVNRLVQVRSDALVEELLVDVPANDNAGYLPDEFLSLASRPQIVGGAFISQLPSSDTSTLEIAGTPKYYQVIGKALLLYPPTDKALTLKLLARLRPASPSAMQDVFPFNGEFDQIYTDGVVAILTGGLPGMIAKQYLPVVQSQVDQLLSGAAGDSEQAMADSINGL